MRLLLIRHGQTPSNVYAALDTAVPGPSLTKLGEQQASALPALLSRENIGAIFASTLTRTVRTAEPLAKELALPITIRAGLREISAGNLEMNHDEESIRIYHETALAWSSGQSELQIPEGEISSSFYARFDEVVNEAESLGHGTVALVSHGMSIRAWVAARACNIDTEFARQHELLNTGVVILEGSQKSGWFALSWGEMPVRHSSSRDKVPLVGASAPSSKF